MSDHLADESAVALVSPWEARGSLIRFIAHRLAGDREVLPVEGRLASFDRATSWLLSEPLTPTGLRGRVCSSTSGRTPASTGCARSRI